MSTFTSSSHGAEGGSCQERRCCVLARVQRAPARRGFAVEHRLPGQRLVQKGAQHEHPRSYTHPSAPAVVIGRDRETKRAALIEPGTRQCGRALSCNGAVAVVMISRAFAMCCGGVDRQFNGQRSAVLSHHPFQLQHVGRASRECSCSVRIDRAVTNQPGWRVEYEGRLFFLHTLDGGCQRASCDGGCATQGCRWLPLDMHAWTSEVQALQQTYAPSCERLSLLISSSELLHHPVDVDRRRRRRSGENLEAAGRLSGLHQQHDFHQHVLD